MPPIKNDTVADVPFVSVPAPVLYVELMDPFEKVLLYVSNTIATDVPERTL